MSRPLTISTDLKLAAHFGRDLDAIKSYFWPIVQVKHVNKVFSSISYCCKASLACRISSGIKT